MYTIKCDDYILSDPRHKDLFVASPKLNLEVNKNGSADFIIYPTHPYYDHLKKLKSIITVYQDGRPIFKGRIVDDELGFYNEKQVSVEGILGFLLDSIQEPFEYTGKVDEFFINLINNHNSQVESFQQFKVGRITVTDPNNYINRSSTDYLTTKEVIESRLLSINGGYLNIRYEDDGNYIDYLDDFEDDSTQIIEFGENLIDLSQKTDAINIKTGIIPLGAKLKDSEGKDTESRLTIESVNGGIKYLIDDEMVEKYGRIFQVITYDDITDASNLLIRAKQELAESVKLSNTIELTAVDLNNVDKNIESFHFCNYIRILSAQHNIDKTYLLQKLNIDLASPENTKITLGKTIKTLTDTTTRSNKDNAQIVTRVNTIYNDYTTTETVEKLITKGIEKNNVQIVTDSLPVKTGRSIDEKIEYIKRINFGSLPESGIKKINTNLIMNNIIVTKLNILVLNKDGIPITFPYMIDDKIVKVEFDNENNILVDAGTYDMSSFTMSIEICFIDKYERGD